MNAVQKVKSVTAIRVGNEWLAQLRQTDSKEFFGGKGQGYTLAQIEACIRANPTREAKIDPITRKEVHFYV